MQMKLKSVHLLVHLVELFDCHMTITYCFILHPVVGYITRFGQEALHLVLLLQCLLHLFLHLIVGDLKYCQMEPSIIFHIHILPMIVHPMLFIRQELLFRIILQTI
ncbi:hypothetical protein EBX93_15565 [bacterium]|nr:hypothetical protein [bacterium]